MKITKKDILFFVLGIFTIFIIESVVDWDETKKSFNEGYNNATKVKNK